MSDNRKNIFTIAPGASFVDALAAGILRDFGTDPAQLSEILIYLPNRRACRHLREAFLRQLPVQAALLPRMQPIGDIDSEEFYFADPAFESDLPPAITPLRRRMLLTQLIAKRDPDLSIDQAAPLAEALADFLDQAQIYGCDMSRLDELVTQRDLAEHWQRTVQFLDILTVAWPTVLAAEGVIDPADRQNRVLQMQSQSWRAKPPTTPVVAAGMGYAMPALVEFLSVIAELPKGMIVLPGLDQNIDEESWQQVGPTHPQYGLKNLLTSLKMSREKVCDWPHAQILPSLALAPQLARQHLLREAMRPAESTESWRSLTPDTIARSAIDGLTRIETDGPQDEALTIALIMRRGLEIPAQTLTLVTPDRALAERVAALLARWDIAVNDSGGTPLAALPVGGFLLALLAAAAPQADAVALLALLKHPLVACGLTPPECRMQARLAEMQVWRTDRPATSPWLDSIRQKLQPITSVWTQKVSLTDRLTQLRKLAENFAATDSETGTERLWFGEAGEQIATLLDDWRLAADGFTPITGFEYMALLNDLLRGKVMRPRYGQHPRLNILGMLEARLIASDVIILGGLNEDIWPPQIEADPWMSRPMKLDFKLPSPDLRIGFSAHDFVQLASLPHVVLTRGRRNGHTPAVASRFLLQLDTVLRALGYSDDKNDALRAREPWADWIEALDKPDRTTPGPMDKPAPRPPLAVRPQRLSVTKIGLWQRNPYAIYAREILRLRKLEPLVAELDASDRGNIIHDALEKFMVQHSDRLPTDALKQLLDIGDKLFTAYDAHPEVRAFWWPRFERIAHWFVNVQQAQQDSGARLLATECKGDMAFGDFTLHGRADRIDRLADGSLSIIDYKTGGVPKKEEVQHGAEPRLPLLALMAASGAFDAVKPAMVSEVSYWHMTGAREAGKTHDYTDIAELIEGAHAGLIALIALFADPDTPYEAIPKPNRRPRYDDYAHLARLAEWGRTLQDAS